ncbi:MAG: hypothetical protein EOO15_10140 [Chitinophagaceae bacterium]|nr:MAG: hypothetical protein EOO15_10140 [Chitinophagaceae bacterium]
MKGGKPLLFFALCIIYAVGIWLLLRGMDSDQPKEDYGTQVRNVIVGSLLGSYALFVAQHFLVGKVSVEYIVIMPVIILFTSFLIGAVLHVAGFDLSGNAFAQAGILHGFFTLLVALRLWRHYWMPRTTNTHATPD